MKAKIANSKRLNILGNSDLSSNREILIAFLKQFRQKLGYFTMFAAFPAILTSQAQAERGEEAKKPEVSVAGETAKPLVRLNNSRRIPELLQRQSSFLLPHQAGKYNNIISALAGGDDCPGNPIPAGYLYCCCAFY
ncbi:MAG: hypothetical protein LC778_01860 [Acidobacteria bacterium]|nr:hypothetical protein [Acidobacteriota bacterium]